MLLKNLIQRKSLSENDFYAVKLLINNNAKIDVIIPSHGGLVDVALENNHLEIMSYLLDMDLKLQGSGFMAACRENNLAALRILEHYSQLDNYKIGSIFYKLVSLGVTDDSLIFLIQNGADCSYTNPLKVDSGTLTVALQHSRSLPLIRSLVENGAPVNTNLEVHPSYNPLHMTISLNRDEICEYLLSVNARFPEVKALLSLSTLEFDVGECLKAGKFDLVLKISEYFECLDFECMRLYDGKKDFWLTPLQAACLNGNYDAVAKFVKSGAEVNNKGNYKTPLKIASENGNKDIIQFLIDYGTEIIDL